MIEMEEIIITKDTIRTSELLDQLKRSDNKIEASVIKNALIGRTVYREAENIGIIKRITDRGRGTIRVRINDNKYQNFNKCAINNGFLMSYNPSSKWVVSLHDIGIIEKTCDTCTSICKNKEPCPFYVSVFPEGMVL